MQWADCCRAAAVALCLAGSVFAAPADQPTYGKVDTFEPGKKYNCVPSADRKSWDCTQTGKATKDDTPPAPAAPAKPRPTPSTPSTPQQTAPASAPRTGTLPSYLLAPGASGRAPQAPAAAPAPVAAPEVHTSTNPPAAAPAAPAAKEVTATPAPAPEAAPKPAPPSPKPEAPEAPASAAPITKTEAPPAPAPKPAPPVRPQAANGGDDFLALSGDLYVIELAHGDSQASIAAAHAALNLPHGQAFELHLRQNGSNSWLLVWGSFDDVGAARAARSELPADAHAGWPRRVAPLQAEVRRTQE